MIFYKGNLDLEDVPTDYGHKVSELNVDVDKDKCSTDLIKKLSAEAKKIEMDYKEKSAQAELYEVDEDSGENYYNYDYFWNVTFKNVTDSFYLRITNDKDENVQTITKDTLVDGKWQFDTKVDDDVVTYTIAVISNVEGCKEQVFRELELKALIFNFWSSTAKCSVYKEFKYCERWIDEDTPTYEEFESELAKYLKEHPEIEEVNPFGVYLSTTTASGTSQTENDKTTEVNSNVTTSKGNKEKKTIKKDNKIIYAGIIVLIIVLGVVIVVLLKKKRSK